MAGVLSRVPGLGGFIEAGQLGQQEQMSQLSQLGAVQGMLAKAQQQKQQAMLMQRDQELQGRLSSLVKETGGDPGKTIQGLLSIGSPPAIELASKLKGLMPTGQSIGSGGLRLPDGTIIPPAGRQQDGMRAPPSRKIVQGETEIHQELQPDGTWKEVGRGPRFARQIAPVVNVGQPRNPQWEEIEDPLYPGSMIKVNPALYNEEAYKKGDKRGVLGRGARLTDAGKIDAKTQQSLTGLNSDLQAAEDLLMGVVRTSDGQVVKGNLPTGSGFGSAVDSIAGFFGASPAGAAEADSLKAVAARLVGRVPRFEGPQSDKDVALYKEAAGNAGNDKLPIPRRLAAVRTMKQIYAGYESGERGRLIQNNRRATDKQMSPEDRQALDWANSNPGDPRAADIKQSLGVR